MSGASVRRSEHRNRDWEWYMRCGDFAAAWEICDDVLRSRAAIPCSHLPRHQQWIWRGGSLVDQRVLVRCFHGLGDTIQFIRLAPLIGELAGQVIVEAQPALLPLLRTASGIDRLVPLTDGAPDVAYDIDVEVMELPHVLRLTLDRLPQNVPYLHAPASDAIQRSRERLAVGVVWCAGDWNPLRSLTIESIKALTTVHGVELHALQAGYALQAWPPEWGPVSARDDVAELASVMRALDLVITIDSMPAHLAGALGVPVWTLLHSTADWRWMADREDSPWYPSMRLFRQTKRGRWRAVMARVTSELAHRAGASLPASA